MNTDKKHSGTINLLDRPTSDEIVSGYQIYFIDKQDKLQVKAVKDIADQHGIEFDNLVNHPGSMGKEGALLSNLDVAKQYGGRYTNMPK